jgi:prolipoprotein diacylglyceryltransferase
VITVTHNPKEMNQEFPRYFRMAGRSINSYKFFLCIGLYVGTLTTAALAARSGLSPLRAGMAAMACALAGLIGARLYFVLVNLRFFMNQRSLAALWDASSGGWSLFGSIFTFTPVSLAAAYWLHIATPVLWDHLALGVLAGGFWIRLGCVFNGCCSGRQTDTWLGVHLHDTHHISKRRIPVQFMEMAWWLIGFVVFMTFWPGAVPAGSYAMAVAAWYGFGRFFLEPMRESSDLVFGRVRIDQLVAALLGLVAGSILIIRGWAT